MSPSTSPTYTLLDNGFWEWRRPVTKLDTVIFRARNIRQTRTGVHAEILIGLNTTILDRDLFNIERSADRVRLAGRVHKGLNGLEETYPRSTLEHDLMLFTTGLWDAQTGSGVGKLYYGDQEDSEAAYWLQPYILADGGTIVFAPGGSGKSWLLMAMAVAIDAGLSEPWVTTQAKVYYINLERSARSMTRRLARVNLALGLPRDRPLLMMNERGKKLQDIYDGAQRTVDEEGPAVVFLDSLSRGGWGDLNANDAANDAMDKMNGLSKCWVVNAHTPRDDPSHIFGAIMFENAADLTVRLLSEKKQDGTLGIGLKGDKANDIPLPGLKVWALEFDKRFSLSGIRTAARLEFPTILELAQPRTIDEWILDQLKAHGAWTQAQLANEGNRNPGTIHKGIQRLLRDGKITEVRREGAKKFYDLVTGREEVPDAPGPQGAPQDPYTAPLDEEGFPTT